jgi:hypothetical protein
MKQFEMQVSANHAFTKGILFSEVLNGSPKQ